MWRGIGLRLFNSCFDINEFVTRRSPTNFVFRSFNIMEATGMSYVMPGGCSRGAVADFTTISGEFHARVPRRITSLYLAVVRYSGQGRITSARNS